MGKDPFPISLSFCQGGITRWTMMSSIWLKFPTIQMEIEFAA